MMINQRNLTDALSIIVQNEDAFTRLKNDFPNILADLTTFKSNPNCSCRGRVSNFFNGLLVTNPTLLDQYIADSAELVSKLSIIEQERQNNNYSGRIFVIGKNEEEWKNFVNSLTGKVFRLINIVERENEVAIYIL